MTLRYPNEPADFPQIQESRRGSNPIRGFPESAGTPKKVARALALVQARHAMPRVSLRYAAKGFADLRELIDALNQF